MLNGTAKTQDEQINAHPAPLTSNPFNLARMVIAGESAQIQRSPYSSPSPSARQAVDIIGQATEAAEPIIRAKFDALIAARLESLALL